MIRNILIVMIMMFSLISVNATTEVLVKPEDLQSLNDVPQSLKDTQVFKKHQMIKAQQDVSLVGENIIQTGNLRSLNSKDIYKKLPNVEDLEKVENRNIILIDKNNKFTIYNNYGQVEREDLENAEITIDNKYISISNYSINESTTFEVVLYVGTHDILYEIKRMDGVQTRKDVLDNGELLMYVKSENGYIRYETNSFSTQVVSIPDIIIQEGDRAGYSLGYFFDDIYNANIDICLITGYGPLTYDCFWNNGDSVNIQAGENYPSLNEQFVQSGDFEFEIISTNNEGSQTLWMELFETNTLTETTEFMVFITARSQGGASPAFDNFIASFIPSTDPPVIENSFTTQNLEENDYIVLNLDYFFSGNVESYIITFDDSTNTRRSIQINRGGNSDSYIDIPFTFSVFDQSNTMYLSLGINDEDFQDTQTINVEACNPESTCVDQDFTLNIDSNAPAGGGGSTTLEDKTISYWNFEEGSGTITLDQKGSNDLTLNGAIFVNSLSGYGLSFVNDNAVDSFVTSNTNIATSFWARFESVIGRQALVQISATGGLHHRVELNGGNMYVQFNGNSYVNQNTGFSPQVGQWYHFAAVTTPTKVEFYVNGVLEFSNTGSFGDPKTGSGSNIYLGKNDVGSTPFNGYLDELYYGEELTQQDVTDLFNSGTPLVYPFTSNVAQTPDEDIALPTIVMAGFESQEYNLRNYYSNYNNVKLQICEDTNFDNTFDNCITPILKTGEVYTFSENYEDSNIKITLSTDMVDTQGIINSIIKVEAKNQDSFYQITPILTDETDTAELIGTPIEILTSVISFQIDSNIEDQTIIRYNTTTLNFNNFHTGYERICIESTYYQYEACQEINQDSQAEITPQDPQYIIYSYSNNRIELVIGGFNTSFTDTINVYYRDISGNLENTDTFNVEFIAISPNGSVTTPPPIDTNTTISDTPQWFEGLNPPDQQKPFYAVGVIIASIIFIAIFSNGSSGTPMAIMVAILVELILFSYLGWLPVWIIIIGGIITAGIITQWTVGFVGLNRGG